MKAKYLLGALIALAFIGCDDNTDGLGLGMFPGSDQNINGRLSTFNVTTQSVPAGRIYAKTNIGYLGKFTDATFGTFKAGFLTELNCPQNMVFPEVYQEYDAKGNPVETGKGVTAKGTMISDGTKVITDNGKEVLYGNVYTTEMYLWYSTYFGDSLTACRLSVYELEKNLNPKEAYYTDIVPANYYNPKDLLGRKAYTAVDLSVSDSIKNLSSYVPSVRIEVNNNYGKRILTESRKKGGDLYKTFNDLFKGIYVNSDYGDGTVLYVDQVQLNVVYQCYKTDSISGLKIKKKYEKDENGNSVDSTYYTYRTFASTREVIQANQMENNSDKINELINTDTWTYLKSPAGIFTEATLPISDVEQKLSKDTLNAVKLTFTSYNQESDKKFGMSIPKNVMLIRKKDKDIFFEKNKLPDNISSFLASHSSSNNQYVFNNITNLINVCIAEKETAKEKAGNSWDEAKWIQENPDWNKVTLIPVLVTDDSSTNSYQPSVISVQHDLKPGYVRLKGGKKGQTDENYKLKLEVVSTNFDGK